MSKRNCMIKIKARLNLSEEGKADLMLDKMEAYYTDQIKTVNRNIKTLTNKHNDYLESVETELKNLTAVEEDAFISIDPVMIKTPASREEYVRVLDKQFNEAIIARKNKEEEAKQELITFEASIASHKEQLELLQYKLNKVM